MHSPMLQEGFYDTSWDGTWRDAIKEKSVIVDNGGGSCDVDHGPRQERARV